MNLKTISFLVFILLYSALYVYGQRTINFPKQKEYVAKLPEKENIWVFIMAGQSNMAGRGFVEPQDTLVNKRILTIDDSNQWVYAKEPLHFYEPSMAGLDSGHSFASELMKYIPDDIYVAILPAAVGGSSIEQWLDDSTHRGVQLMTNMESKIELANKVGVLKAILWHQGESNAKDDLLDSYNHKLTRLIEGFRKTSGNIYLPVLIGQLGHFANPPKKQQLWDSLNIELEKYTTADPFSYLVLTNGLKHKGDNVHFNSGSQRELGKRFARKYIEIHINRTTDFFNIKLN